MDVTHQPLMHAKSSCDPVTVGFLDVPERKRDMIYKAHKRLVTNFQRTTPSSIYAEGFKGRIVPFRHLCDKLESYDHRGWLHTRTKSKGKTMDCIWIPLGTTDKLGDKLYREAKKLRTVK